jgi:hypothetical protein
MGGAIYDIFTYLNESMGQIWAGDKLFLLSYPLSKVRRCLRHNCVANLMEVKVLYVQQDLRYEISSYWPFNV